VNFDALIELTTKGNLRWYHTWTMVEWAEAFLARNEPGDKEQALEMLGEAQMQFEDMGADGYVSIVAARLEALS
jgi:hypothetical protein